MQTVLMTNRPFHKKTINKIPSSSDNIFIKKIWSKFIKEKNKATIDFFT